MTMSTRKTIVARIAGATLLIGALLGALPGPAQAEWGERSFVWKQDTHAGDCTLFAGATWTLYVDGRAHFTGLVTSGDDDDAWLMYAELYDRNGSYKANIIAQQPGVDNIARFVINLPDSDSRYPWDVWGTYEPTLFNEVGRIDLKSHC